MTVTLIALNPSWGQPLPTTMSNSPSPVLPSFSRRSTLLRAAYDLLKRSADSSTVLEAAAIPVRFDDADCDGGCLMQDIAAELGLNEDTPAIPLSTDPLSEDAQVLR
jgi:hypothetical protein